MEQSRHCERSEAIQEAACAAHDPWIALVSLLAMTIPSKRVLPLPSPAPRRGGRVVDRAALEMRSTRKRTGGSNPSLSATT